MKEAGGVDSPGAWSVDSMRHACGLCTCMGLWYSKWYSEWFVAMNGGVWCQGCKMVVRPRLG